VLIFHCYDFTPFSTTFCVHTNIDPLPHSVPAAVCDVTSPPVDDVTEPGGGATEGEMSVPQHQVYQQPGGRFPAP